MAIYVSEIITLKDAHYGCSIYCDVYLYFNIGTSVKVIKTDSLQHLQLSARKIFKEN